MEGRFVAIATKQTGTEPKVERDRMESDVRSGEKQKLKVPPSGDDQIRAGDLGGLRRKKIAQGGGDFGETNGPT